MNKSEILQRMKIKYNLSSNTNLYTSKEVLKIISDTIDESFYDRVSKKLYNITLQSKLKLKSDYEKKLDKVHDELQCFRVLKNNHMFGTEVD
jgi:hypothetical protein